MLNKNILKPIGFLIGLFIILSVLSYFFIPTNSIEQGPYKKSGGILKEPRNTIDYFVIGDSECNTSISPMELWKEYGFTGYNCGVPGQRLQDTYYMLQLLLQKQSPKVILLETNAFYRDFDYTEALQKTADDAAEELFPIYKYHNNWKMFSFDMLKEINKNPKYKHSNPFKGFHYYAEVRPYKNGPYIEKTKQVEPIHDQPLTYLNKIVALCKENNIELVLYSVPSPLCWTYAKHNAAEGFAKKNGLTLLDLNLYNKVLGIDWKNDTRDKGNHVNFYGAKKVTHYIGEYLYKHSKLTDHRKDKRYKSWNNTLKKYLELTNKI